MRQTMSIGCAAVPYHATGNTTSIPAVPSINHDNHDHEKQPSNAEKAAFCRIRETQHGLPDHKMLGK
jgi:hypothetical protein